ncbi:conserved hypothetical protein [uncultured delta proteobacterium]|uniref:Carrier domain-containing protein n=1 Tax=uncultured delta proteobacterium TaxID=34034 RepID=A0A212JWN4_9DELT|nr:conserved hypothetical protein [uncultured delta proteobacterium]
MEEAVLKILQDMHPDFSFDEDVNFIEESYLDSFDIVTLVAELEEKFDVLISALDIVPENFFSIASICALVKRSESTQVEVAQKP